MKPKSTRLSFLSIASSAVLTVSSAHAATLYWDGGTVDIGTDGNGLSGGTAGNWDATLLNWDRGANLSHIAWNNSNLDFAVLGGTAGTVTLAAPITVGGLQFNTNAYTVTAGVSGLTFGATNNTIAAIGANSNITATISGTVGGTDSIVFKALNGPSANTVNFTGASAGGWSGTTTINQGMTLAVGTTTASDPTNRALFNTSGITINGGGLTLNFASGFSTDRISDSAAISVSGGGTFAIGTSNATLSETVGAVTLNSGQFNLNHINNPSSGGTITLTDFTRSGATSALTISQGANGRFRNAAVSTDTAAGEIIGAWATTGGQNGIGAQNDYAIYGNGNGTFLARGIAASEESTWSTSHAATSNFTMSAIDSGTISGGSGRNLNTLRSLSNSVTVTSGNPDITLTGHTLAVGDLVTFSAGTMPTGLTAGTAYYVVATAANTIQVSATKGGLPITPTTAGATVVAAGGIQVSSGNDLGTFGILNGSATTLHILRDGAGGALTLPTTAVDNLHVTTGAGAITIGAPIINNTGALTLVKGGTGGGTSPNFGVLTLTGTNTYTGGTVVNAGTLTFGTAGSWVSGQNLTFGGTGSIAASVGAISGGTLNVGTGANGTITGTSGITFTSTSGAGTLIYGGGSSATLNIGDANGFTGNVLLAIGIGGTNPRPTLRFSNMADTAGSVLGWGAGGQNDSNQRAQIEFNGASGALTFNSRQLAVLPRTSGNNMAKSLIVGNNNSNATHTWTINTDFLNNGDRSGQGLIFEGSNAGNNEFAGDIGNSNYNGAVLNVYKTGSGRWIFSGDNTFTGRLIAGQGTLSVDTLNEVGTAGPLGMNNNIQLGGDERTAVGGTSIELRLSGSNSGTLEYTGGAVTSTRSFFIGDSAAGNTGGGTIANNGTGAITFSAATFNPTQTGITATRTLTLAGANTAANDVQGVIQDNVATTGVVNLAKSGTGRWIASGTNTYSGTTTVNGGALQAVDGTGLPTNSILQLRGGVFQSSGTITRSVGTAAGNVNWSTSSGGFAAIGGTLTLNLNGGTGSLTWNGSSMVSTGQTLIFGSTTADSLVDWQNDLNLGSSGSGQRTIQVNDNTGSATDIARISGVITNTAAGWGIIKTGDGTLQLSNSNTYTGTTTINAGTLVITGATQATSAITFGGGVLGLDIASPVTAAGATVDFTGQTVTVIGTPTLSSYTLLTVGTMAGGDTEPALSPAIPGYELDVVGNELRLISTGAPVGYAAWQAANGTGGTRDQDHDNDGVDNGTEHFLGGDTTTTGFTPLPGVVNTGGILSVTWVRHPNYSAATFPGNYGTDFVVETSTTLAGPWTPETPAGTNVIITGNNVTYTFPGGPGYSGKRFARLKVTGP